MLFGAGEVMRNSDTAISAAVNELARVGGRVTLANPIGIYMTHLHDAGWTSETAPRLVMPVDVLIGA